MADRKIIDFTILEEANDDDLLLIASESVTYAIKVKTLKDAVEELTQQAKAAALKAQEQVGSALVVAELAGEKADSANEAAQAANTAAGNANTAAGSANTAAAEATAAKNAVESVTQSANAAQQTLTTAAAAIEERRQEMLSLITASTDDPGPGADMGDAMLYLVYR